MVVVKFVVDGWVGRYLTQFQICWNAPYLSTYKFLALHHIVMIVVYMTFDIDAGFKRTCENLWKDKTRILILSH